LAFPLLTGLGLANPTVTTFALALSALCFFLGHEPLAVLLGVRGVRLKKAMGERARRRAAALILGGSFLGAAAAVQSWELLWPSVLVPSAPALLLLPLVLSGRQKTLPGELLVVTAFSTLVLPLGISAGADPALAGAASVLWWVSFFLGTLEVHAIKARYKERARRVWTRWASPAASLLTLAVCLVALSRAGSGFSAPFLALVPPALAVLSVDIARVHPRNLKRVGWALVGANTLSLAFLLAGGRI
jgi:hypothetical protein